MVRQWYSTLSMRTKITGISLGITVLAAALVATISLFQIRSHIAAEEHRSAESLAMSIARASELELTVGDQKELSRITASFLRDDSVLFIACFGKGKQPMASAIRDAQAWDQYRRGFVDSRLCVIGEQQVESSIAKDEFAGETEMETSSPVSG